jgi:hypothetical protein
MPEAISSRSSQRMRVAPALHNSDFRPAIGLLVQYLSPE